MIEEEPHRTDVKTGMVLSMKIVAILGSFASISTRISKG